MNRSSMASKGLAALVLGSAALFGAGAAQARDVDVQWSVTIGTPGLWVRSAPVYAAPVYAAPVYAAPVVVWPAPVYGPPPRLAMRHARRFDRDADGVPDRYDRLYNPPWDRDGDGIPDRQEWRDGWRR